MQGHQNYYKNELYMQPTSMAIVTSVCGDQNNSGEQREQRTRICQTPANKFFPSWTKFVGLPKRSLGVLNQNNRRHQQTGYP
jgi:hypothetical protein